MDERNHIRGLGYEGQQSIQKSKPKGDHDFGQRNFTWGFLGSIQAISWLFSINLQPFNFGFYLPPNVTNVMQPLAQGTIASFKMCYKSKLQKGVLSQYEDSSKHNLRKM